ncbi:MAG: methyltransferase dimerization domain-containing protein, partial [Candidatus Binatota bacterium]
MSKQQETKKELSPRPLMQLLGDFGNSRILDAAIEYDFFTLIHGGFHSYEEIAREAGTVPRATRIVLDSLIALALVEKHGEGYFLAPISETYLV